MSVCGYSFTWWYFKKMTISNHLQGILSWFTVADRSCPFYQGGELIFSFYYMPTSLRLVKRRERGNSVDRNQVALRCLNIGFTHHRCFMWLLRSRRRNKDLCPQKIRTTKGLNLLNICTATTGWRQWSTSLKRSTFGLPLEARQRHYVSLTFY